MPKSGSSIATPCRKRPSPCSTRRVKRWPGQTAGRVSWAGPVRKLTLAAALLAGWAQAARAQAAAPASEHARRLLEEALVASRAAPRAIDAGPDLVARFKLAAQAAPRSAPALLDYAVALDRAANLERAEAAYLAAASAADFPELRLAAAERAASPAVG